MRESLLIFPDDVAAGYLWASRGDKTILSLPARGHIRVPLDTPVGLDLTSPVRGLYSLAPNAIRDVWVPKKTTTDEDLAHVSHLTGLRSLHASKARLVTDGGVAHLARLRHIQWLDLYQAGVTDDGLRHLAGMIHLERLHLGCTCVQGPGVRHLARLQRLVRLSLENTDVDDDVVPHLLALRSLQTLAIWGTRLSTKGLATLRAGLPGCTVAMRDPGQRLAKERARRGIMALLARRLRPDVRRKLSDAEIRTLIPPGSRLVGVGVLGSQRTAMKEGLDIGDFDVASRWLGHLPLDRDLHIVTPNGLDVWIPWLRPRGKRNLG